ncbi:MAG: lipase family protein [Firmicutes bacterium]|nr:lipase family protein [Bacillota bacterium]
MKRTSVTAITALLLAAALCACSHGAPPVTPAEPETLPAGSVKPILTWDYSADKYDQTLAQQAALYAMLAYEDSAWADDGSYYSTGEKKAAPEALHAQLTRDGYQAIESANYGNEDENDISYTLAWQDVNEGQTLLVAVLRGTDGLEWRGNMDIGRGLERHESFEKANKALQAGAQAYAEKHRLEDILFFVTGHSRGAAVANLFAADLSHNLTALDSGAARVFCYTFATPNNTTALSRDPNIFNFCFTDDFVPQVPLARWGYGKYGTTFTASAQKLYWGNRAFRGLVITNISLSYDRRPSFDRAATEKVLEEFYQLSPSVEAYYTKEYEMAPDHGWITGEVDLSMHGFMCEYIGNAAALGLADLGSSVGSALKRLPAGNEVKAVADYFIEGWLPPHSRYSINDTHQPYTYYAALTTGGFPVPGA